MSENTNKNEGFASKILADINKEMSSSGGDTNAAGRDNSLVRESMIRWFCKSLMRCGYDLNSETVVMATDYLRGYNMWLCGSVGVGKTYFFDCVNKIRAWRCLEPMQKLEPIQKLSMLETQGWTMEDARTWCEDVKSEDVLIDDVGTEPVMKSWGVEAEVFPYILEKRIQIRNRRTHLTSNLGIIDIKKRYGERVSDRFVQMFKMFQFKCKKSRRSLSVWKAGDGDGGGVL